MLKSQDQFFYNRWRAQWAKPVRKFMDMRFGLPEGYRDANSTYDIEARSAQQAAMLRQMGFFIDQLVEWGYDPQELYVMRGMPVPDPAMFVPAADMVVSGGTQPFTKWFMQHSDAFNEGADSDPTGIGTLYEANPDDRLDVGAQWSGSITVPNTTTVISGKWEKVIWRVYNSRPVAWERIA